MLQKQMTGSKFSEIATKNSTTIECMLFVISYYMLFVYLVFGIRYLVLHAQII